MSKKPTKYHGKTYPTVTALVAEHGRVPVGVVNSRLHNGWDLHAALTVPVGSCLRGRHRPVTFEGVNYHSRAALHRAIKKELREVCHRSPNITFRTFSKRINTHNVCDAVKRMRSLKYHRIHGKDLKKSSKILGGADNLVCQRMTKLGWSYAKAISTPVGGGRGQAVKYKGKIYPSIADCYRKTHQTVSYKKFARFMRAYHLYKG